MSAYGFGLLAPDIRASFGLGSGALGVLAAASYLAYLTTSVTAGVLTDRLGPRAIVAAGGLCAVVGMAVAGLARSPGVLFAGLLVAGASAGLVFPPFSDVVVRVLTPARRPRVMAAISSGTGWGVAVAAPVSVAVGTNWRAAWLVFAVLAAAATAWALRVVPGRAKPAARGLVRLSPSWLVCPRSGPLLAGAGLLGLASSVYWTFAVDHLVTAGGVPSAASRLFLAAVGVASVGGAVSGDAVRRLGGRTTFALALAAEAAALVLLGLAPSSLEAAFASALLFGAAYNVAVAVQVIWSAKVFADRPSAGLAAVMGMSAVGFLAGPPLAGVLADSAGFAWVFCGAGAVLLATIGLAPREPLDPS
jgi:predicted MFS family arabinose efflux permease